MTSHRPSRWLGPLALLAAVAAVFAVVSASTGDGDGDAGSTTASTQERRDAGGGGTSTGEDEEQTATAARTTTSPQRRTYTVRPGDTLALIAERTGVSVEELQELNPRLDPNNLTVGTKIKLTE